MRGNRRRGRHDTGAGRSIPACAGEPPCPRRTTGSLRVYPRVCGGTRSKPFGSVVTKGLSPRVRGNLAHVDIVLFHHRSIPACAGEPRTHAAAHTRSAVYPRVCGGTRLPVRGSAGPAGLSPRVRGNRPCAGETTNGYGSIPACAGEPCQSSIAVVGCGVYPRVCGGTRHGLGTPGLGPGLSPRVRGNPGHWLLLFSSRRSIPACAGEPHKTPPPQRDSRVYPRVCGGTVTSVLLLIR